MALGHEVYTLNLFLIELDLLFSVWFLSYALGVRPYQCATKKPKRVRARILKLVYGRHALRRASLVARTAPIILSSALAMGKGIGSSR